MCVHKYPVTKTTLNYITLNIHMHSSIDALFQHLHQCTAYRCLHPFMDGTTNAKRVEWPFPPGAQTNPEVPVRKHPEVPPQSTCGTEHSSGTGRTHGGVPSGPSAPLAPQRYLDSHRRPAPLRRDNSSIGNKTLCDSDIGGQPPLHSFSTRLSSPISYGKQKSCQSTYKRQFSPLCSLQFCLLAVEPSGLSSSSILCQDEAVSLLWGSLEPPGKQIQSDLQEFQHIFVAHFLDTYCS